MEKLSNDRKNISASGIIFGSLIAQRGPRGEQGIQGVQGDKPIKGIDYFTEEDKEEIVQETGVVVNERFTPEFEQMQKDIEGAIKNINDMKEAYNNNASEKTAEFNTNAENKINEYNANAENLINKTEELKLENTRLRNQIPTGLAEGKSITINDSSNLQYKKFNIRGKSIQDGTPTPELPIEIQSVGDDVNLISGLVKGIALNADNGAELSSSIKATTDYIKVDFNKNPNYFLSGLTETLQTFVAAYNSNKEFLGRTGANLYKYLLLTSSSFTGGTAQGTGDIAYLRITTYENTGHTTGSIDDIDNLKIKLQKGTVATAYSEYGKGTVEIKQSGENLAESELESGYTTTINGITFTVNNDCSILVNGTSTATSAISLFLKKNFSISSGTYLISGGTSNVAFQIYEDGGWNYASSSMSKKFTLTEKSNNAILRLRIASGITVENETVFPMISKEDAETTEYEQYKGNNYVIQTTPLRSLQNGVCDTKEKDGTHIRVGSVVLDGSDDENWAISGATFYSDYIKDYKKGDIIPVSNYFVGVNSKNGAGKMLIDNTIAFGNQDVPADRIYIKYDSITTVEEFKSWLQENPIQVDYELAEEVIEPFDEEQQAVIDEIYNTGTFKGVTNISSSSLIEPEFDIEYYKDLETILNNLTSAITVLGGEANV